MGKPDEFAAFIAKVDGYHKAIEEEYTVISQATDTDQVRTLIDKKIAAALPGFVDDLILIASCGDSDNARLSAIKFAFNWYFKESSNAEDPFTKMLEELTRAESSTK